MKPTATILCILARLLATGAFLLISALTPITASAAHGSVAYPVGTNAYDSLILRARAGEPEPALTYLRQRGNQASRAERFDHIQIASWAGQPEEVLAVYASLQPDAAPPPTAVLQAVARALRDLRRWPEALAAWRRGLAQYPQEQAEFAAGLVLTLVDAGQAEQAIRTGLAWLERTPTETASQHADLRLALAYAYATQARPYDALFQTDQALQLAPQTPWVQREYVFALARAGLFEPALRFARQRPELLTPAQQRALQADAAALKTRLAVMPTRSEAERFVIADRALALYAQMLDDWQTQGPQADTQLAADITRIRIDRLSALHARARMHDVVREYEALVAQGIHIPAWALANVASAYLYLRQPERARDLYRNVLATVEAATPPETRNHLGPAAERLEYDVGLFYALVEAEQLDDIGPVLERINNYGPAWLYAKGNPRPVANTRYLDAQLVVVAASMVADDTPAAQARVESMVQAAPNNTSLHTMLAGIYRARAQPRRAETQLKLAEAMTPRALALQLGQAEVALDLQEWRQAEALSTDTLARAPENLAAQRLARQWSVHNKAELRVTARKDLASDAPVSGSGDLSIDMALYTPPFAYDWRGFAGLGYAQGQYREGRGYARWQRAGVAWRSRDWWVEGEASANRYGYGSKLGLRLAAAYDVNDHWQLGGGIERAARETPLRALRSDISSHALQTYLRWRAHERRAWRLDVSAAHFSDGNDRRALRLTGEERLYTRARLKLDLLFEASTQGNSQDDDRPYFNPKRDLMLLPALRATHILYRRYETVWEHDATLSAGAYRQRGDGYGSVLQLTYGQRWRINDVFEIGASVSGISRPYDGNREREWQLLLHLNLRF